MLQKDWWRLVPNSFLVEAQFVLGICQSFWDMLWPGEEWHWHSGERTCSHWACLFTISISLFLFVCHSVCLSLFYSRPPFSLSLSLSLSVCIYMCVVSMQRPRLLIVVTNICHKQLNRERICFDSQFQSRNWIHCVGSRVKQKDDHQRELVAYFMIDRRQRERQNRA